MYEISKDKLISFIKQVSSLKQVIINDINNNPIIKINSFEVKDGYYYIKGVIKTLLSPIYREETRFRVKVKPTKRELVLWTKQKSFWNIEDADNGQVFDSIDTFKVHNIDGKKYLSHSSKLHKVNDVNSIDYQNQEESKELFVIDNLYSLRDGFSKNFEKVDTSAIEKQEEIKKEIGFRNKVKRRVKKIIRK